MTEILEEQTSVTVTEGAGARLKRERESQGVSMADVAHALRLSEKQIAALEADEYQKLPGRTFVRGFIRNYARLVQLDADPLMALLDFGQDEVSHQIQAPSQKISFSEHQGKPWLKWLMMVFVVVAVVSWAVLEWLGPEQSKVVAAPRTALPAAQLPHMATVPALPKHTPTPVVNPPVAPVEGANVSAPNKVPETVPARLTMSFTGRAWVEVRDKNGKILHSQNNVVGADQVVEGEAPLSLVIGSSPNVKLIYKGQPVDLSAYAKADVARLTLE